MLIIYTGKGKGKTEAAFGLALRALGRGLKVGVVQFIKSMENASGEVVAIKKYKLPIDVFVSGAGFLWQKPKNFKSHKEAAEAAWKKSIELLEKDYDLVVLDELNVALRENLLDLNTVLETISKFKEKKHICITGRGAPKELIEIGDYVTEFDEIKHPFKKGIQAQRGIDF